jgi:hypothetical protein
MLTGMGLVQRQFNRYERKLADVMAPGEKILAYDVGRFDDGRGVNALASTHAFYFMFNGGKTGRVAYTDIVGLHASPGFIAMDTSEGNHFAFTFKRPSKTFPGVLLGAADARVAAVRRFSVSWGTGAPPTGLRFTVEPDGEYTLAQTGVWEEILQLSDHSTMQRACSELDVALGLEPKFRFSAVAAGASLTWVPALPVP